ncbi:hypothetical protein [Nitrospira calida]|jgi:predicted Zn-ribbon and HTH transcriptional regulator
MRHGNIRPEPEACYLALYNTESPSDLFRWMTTQVGNAPWAADLLRQAFPAWMDASQQLWQRYKRFAERWVRDELTEADWRHLWRWLGTDAQTVFQRVCPLPDTPRWSLAAWLISAMKTNPHEPFQEAYRQIAERTARERLTGLLRPRLCLACGRLFEPDRVTQQYCQPRCATRLRHTQWRARRQRRTQITGTRESGETARSGDAPPSPLSALPVQGRR